MKSQFRYVGIFIGLVATIAFAVHTARTLRLHDLSRYAAPAGLAAICSASLLYVLVIPISSFAWQRLLADLGTRRRWLELVEIMSVTQMAKYIPGNVAQHIGRAGMSRACGISMRSLIISVAAETVLAVTAAVVVGLSGVALSHGGVNVISQKSLYATAIVAALAWGMIAILTWGRRRIHYIMQQFVPAGDSEAHESNTLPRIISMFLAFIAYIANYVLIGMGITAMAALLFPALAPDAFLLTGSFALAWVAGFLAFGTPAGFGVRESLMLAMLSRNYSGSEAVVLIIAIRLSTTAGDIFIFLVGSALSLASSRGKS